MNRGEVQFAPESTALELRKGVEQPLPRAETTPWWLWLIVLLVCGYGGYWLAQHTTPQKVMTAPAATKPSTRSVAVAVATVRQGDLPIYLSGLGSVTPLNTVTVRSRVDGQLLNVRVQEGQQVRKGDVLAEVDARPYQAQLQQAQGQLARDQALLQQARLDLKRYQLLWKQNSIAKQTVDQQGALVSQYEGTVKIDQGLIDAAMVNVTYCQITAPIAGRVGLRLIDPGNIIRAGDSTGILMITQLQPMTVVFTLAEDNLPLVSPKLYAGHSLLVDAYDRANRKKIATGRLLTVDNQIDPTTGTVRLKAQFANDDNALFPNQFVNARLLVETKHTVILVPDAALQRSQQQTFVYVVKPDHTVTVRPVTVGATEGSDTIVESGLVAGDMVVVSGVDKLREGSVVAVQQSDAHERQENE